ncbi:hypothetical protein AOC36_09270 [Erysipelothrix larvae]|uniref:Uncharacterized protein n=1 Tax=Erysipelothrix larvae TaxID=1514105 RepID=A0A109UHF2_9FIRM|nr:hypothetical protein [Erysipelothrix larvae]AMC94172.1 hypothetical protein AOC36_09270 [Erysipelothrix larvae]
MLIYEELKKLWSQRFIRGVLLISLFLSVGMMYISKTSLEKDSVNISAYSELKDNYDSLEIDVATQEIAHEIETLNLYIDYETYIALPDIAESMRQEYYNDAFMTESFIQDYQTFVRDFDINETLMLYQALFDYYTMIQDFPRFVEDSINVIEAMENQPFWKNYSEQRKDYYSKQSAYFENLRGVSLSSENHKGVDVLLGTNLEPILIIVGIFIFLSVFEIDHTTQMNDLLLITNKGRTRTTIAKLIAGTMSLLGVFISIYALLILTNQLIFSSINWLAPIQSFPSLAYSSFNMSLGRWFMWMVSGQFVGMLALSFLFGLLYQVIPNRIQAVFSFLLIFSFSAGLYFTIQDTMMLVPFKYLNVYALIQARDLFQSYSIIETLGFSLSKINFIYGVGIIICIIGTICIIVLRNAQLKPQLSINLRFDKLHATIVPRLKRFGFESYKGFIMQKGWLVVLVIGLYLGNIYIGIYQGLNIKTLDEKLVEVYREHGGELNEEKILWIDTQYDFYDNLNKQLSLNAKAYKDHTITEEAYYDFINEYLSHSVDKAVFNQFYDHYITNNSEELVYPNGYQALFSINTETREFRNALLLIVLLVLVLSPIIAFDYEQDPDGIATITKKGNLPLFKSKIKLAYLIAFGAVIIVSLVDLFTFSSIYTMDAWQSTFQSILPSDFKISNIPAWVLDLKLWQYLLLVWVLRLSGAIFSTSIILWISSKFTSIVIVFIMTGVVLLLPLLMILIGIQSFEALSLHSLLMGNGSIFNGTFLTSLIVYGFIALISNYSLYIYYKNR